MNRNSTTGRNLVSSSSTSQAKVIQFISGDEIDCRFEAELTTLMVEGDDVPREILDAPNFVLLPSEVLSTGENLANLDFLELIEGENFDEEFGDGESSSSDSEEDDDDPKCGQDWVTAKIEAAREDCDEFEQKLLEAVVRPDDIDATFDDIRVDPGAIRSLRALTSLAGVDPKAFTYGVLAKEKILGVLLHGPPGTGKTLLAKAVAKEARAIFLHISSADFLSKWLGEYVKFVRAIFSLARKLDPCVIFIDEADSVFRQRKSDDTEWRRDVISQFLLEWDGVGGSGRGGFVMAATNRMDDIDPAILRRLPRRIFLGPPSAEDREAILKLQLRGEKLGPDVDLSSLARMTTSYTGSDLKNLCVSAAMAAVYDQLLDSDGNLKAQEKHTKSRRRRVARRVLSLCHFEHAMVEVAASKEETNEQAAEPKVNGKATDIEDDIVASFKPFGKMYADNTIEDVE